ncbi:hypothetical protein Q5Y75_09585 [Ruegeria sp. 2205SS24-7]|uniref:hypothetical protein n=1 Tax=Ruegeria discodermiae TaxID=3064389 RepID=UPI0027428AEF|nr:hypothetical protein [Ruegeria sp. 2205SS24-7]MDP5217467.1 hypothetical protein [Ruegeria sp. 2205SS24-7]
MKPIALFLTIALTGFVATTASAGEIKKEKQFLEEVAGRKLVMGHSWVRIAPEGSVSGRGPKGGEITGNWQWDGRYYCRDITIDAVPLAQDCQTVSVRGNVVTFTHKKGKGVPVSWVIE